MQVFILGLNTLCREALLKTLVQWDVKVLSEKGGADPDMLPAGKLFLRVQEGYAEQISDSQFTPQFDPCHQEPRLGAWFESLALPALELLKPFPDWAMSGDRLPLTAPLWSVHCEAPLFVILLPHPAQEIDQDAPPALSMAAWERFATMARAASEDAPVLVISELELTLNPKKALTPLAEALDKSTADLFTKFYPEHISLSPALENIITDHQLTIWERMINDDLSSGFADDWRPTPEAMQLLRRDYELKSRIAALSTELLQLKSKQVDLKHDSENARQAVLKSTRYITQMMQSKTWRVGQMIVDPMKRVMGKVLPIREYFDRNLNERESLDYDTWVELHDTLTEQDRTLIAQAVERLAYKPTISVVVPVYNTDERVLRLCLDSVLNQLYPHWELCIADDASTAPHIRPLLEEYQRRDSRVKVVFRTENGHISKASNSALELVTGEFTALLDHDDMLTEHALYIVAETLNENPHVDLCYSDEDKIDMEEKRYDPYFKAKWNPDLFYSQNYLCHLSVYRTTLLKEVGGFRHEFLGSQDYDLALRVIEATTPERIRHIPYILYHWRAIAGSTALAIEEKDYAVEAARNALNEHFDRTEQNCSAVPTGDGRYTRIRHELPKEAPFVSIIVPSTCAPKHLDWCEELLNATTYPNFEYVIVANNIGSKKGEQRLGVLTAHPKVRVINYDKKFNYSDIYNTAVPQTKGDIIAILNDDLLVITPDWLEEMVAHALRPDVGQVGCMLYYDNDQIQHAGMTLGIGGVAGHAYRFHQRGTDKYFCHAQLTQNYSGVTCACAVMRREVFDEVGGMDTGLPVAFNDVDLSLRIRKAGYRIVWTPFAELYHLESISRGSDQEGRNRVRFMGDVKFMHKRWGATLFTDPYYSPNLSLNNEDFAFASPPRLKKPWREHPPVIVNVDLPAKEPMHNPFKLRGWIVSDSEIKKLRIDNPAVSQVRLYERFSIRCNTPYPHARGFRAMVDARALEGNTLRLEFELGDGKYNHIHKFIFIEERRNDLDPDPFDNELDSEWDDMLS